MIKRFSIYGKRFLAIFLGFCVAMLVIGFVATFALDSGSLLQADPDAQLSQSWRIFSTMLVLSGMAAGAIILPFIVLVFVAEWYGIRHILFFVLAGGLFAVVSVFFISEQDIDMFYIFVLTTAGLAAGAIYWFLSGRHSGKWIDQAVGQWE